MNAYTSTFRNLVKMVTCALLLTLIGMQLEITTMVMLQYTFVMFGMRNVTNGMPTMLDGMMVANEGYPHNRFCWWVIGRYRGVLGGDGVSQSGTTHTDEWDDDEMNTQMNEMMSEMNTQMKQTDE